MPDNEQKSREDTTATLRETVNNAYGYLKGSENTDSFQAVTFEEMMQRQLDSITGKNGSGSSEMQRIQKVQADLVSCVDTIKNTAQDKFPKDPNAKAVNTP